MLSAAICAVDSSITVFQRTSLQAAKRGSLDVNSFLYYRSVSTASTGLILGIESSCDETAAAVVRRGTEALSNVVASQMALHANYGGVVPELASREHLRNIVPVVREALHRANVTFADLDAIAVTSGPGLAGALLVGITYAKALAAGLAKPLIAVNHLEGHIHAVLMQQGTGNRGQG